MSDSPKLCPLILAGVKASGSKATSSEAECREQHCAWWVEAIVRDGYGNLYATHACAVVIISAAK